MKLNNNIKESYCSFEVSKLLKEKGFDVFCEGTFTEHLKETQHFKVGIKFEEGGILHGRNSMHHSNEYYTMYSAPTQGVVLKWLQVNLNTHIEPIWDIENGEKVWFCSITQIGDLENKAIDTPFKKTSEEAIDDAILMALGQKPVEKESIKEIDYEAIKELVIEEYKNGNVVVSGFEGLQTMPLSEFIKQPAEGILYDLNRSEAVVLTFFKDPKWINDYAVAKVIQELKKQLDEKK